MLYNAGITKEVNMAYENNAGLNIGRDIERLKEFAKAMGHSVLAEQVSELNVSLNTLRSAFVVAMCDYERDVDTYFALVGDIKLIYLNTDKGYVATTINGQYPFYFEDDSVFKAYAQSSTGEFVECYTRQSYMWQHELPYIILLVNRLTNVTDITGTDKGVDISYKTWGGVEYTFSLRFNYKDRVFKGKDDARGISFKNAMDFGSKLTKWINRNQIKKGA